MDPREVSNYDGMILMFSSISKESFDSMMYFYIRMQATNITLIPRIVVCNKIDLLEDLI